MMNSIFAFYEEHIIVLYSLHIIISFFLSLFLSIYLIQRYIKKNDHVDAMDLKRLERIELHSRVFKYLFQLSLHKHNQITIFLFLFLFNVTIIFFGYFFSLWIAWYLINVNYEVKVENTDILNLDEFGMSFLKVERVFGEGSMRDLIVSEYASKSKKLKALSSLASNLSPTNLQILRETLSSTDDEVRMFGYAVINKAETALNQKINKQLEIIRIESFKSQKKDSLAVALAAKELAFLYWEMVYIELSHDSLKNNFLISVITYIELAKEYFVPKVKNLQLSADKQYEEKENSQIVSQLYMLMGRVLMSKKMYEEAKTEFTIAQEMSPEDSTHILPYLAEVYYITGRYSVVQSLLSDKEGLEFNAMLYPIVDQWRKN